MPKKLEEEHKKKPLSKLAICGMTVTIIAIIGILLAGGGYRQDWWGVAESINLVTTSLALATIALIIFIISIFRIIKGKKRGLFLAILGIVLTLPLAAAGAQMFYKKHTFPMINDITTDTQSPPSYWAAPVATNYGGASVADQQHESYPDIEPLTISASPQMVYSEVLELMTSRGWDVIGQRPDEGELEAVAHSRLFDFSDDIIVRITPQESGSRVDMRSRSRVGRSDFGVNAARIKAFLTDLASNTN